MKDVSVGSSEEKGKGFFGQLIERYKGGKTSARQNSILHYIFCTNYLFICTYDQFGIINDRLIFRLKKINCIILIITFYIMSVRSLLILEYFLRIFNILL